MHMQDSTIETLTSTIMENTGKRAFGTTDPDYISLPDVKRLKILEARGEEELCDRVVKVVEKEFYKEIMDTELSIEDIDNKILQVQQYMHTLRYLSALKLCSFNEVKSEPVLPCEPLKLLQDNHPAVRRYLTKIPSVPKPSGENFQAISSVELPTSVNLPLKLPTSSSDFTELPTSENLSSKERILQGKEFKDTITPSVNKEIIPIQPESRAVITQGRKGRLQTKLRVVVGNTYQYLQDAQENGNQLKFKWRVYVRGPPEHQDISSFVSSVSFKLDKSYAPHDVIKICEFPFTVSRRGWGEFKIHLELSFQDPRNKPVKMLHSLRLSRHNDPLALTGLWRLGEETWYDVWLYDKNENITEELPKMSKMSAENYAKQLVENFNSCGIKTETVYSDSEGNVTFLHDSGIKLEVKENSKFRQDQVNIEKSEKESLNVKDNLQNQAILCDRLNECSFNNESGKNVTNFNAAIKTMKQGLSENVNQNGKNLCKILIRRADGKLVSCMVPKEMYEMALKLSAEKNQKSNIKKINPLNENAPSAGVDDNKLQSAENEIAANQALNNLNRSLSTSSKINIVKNSDNKNNAVPLNSKRIVFKQNSNNNNNVKHSIIRMQSFNGLTTVPVKQPTQALTLRLSSPNVGPIKLHTTGTNNVNQSQLNSAATLNSSNSVPNNPIVSSTPSKNTRIIQTPDGCKFLVTSSVLPNKTMSDNPKNFNETSLITKNNTRLLSGISNKPPVVLNNKILCKFQTSTLNAGIVTLPTLLNSNKVNSNLPLSSKLKVSPINANNKHSNVFNIRPSNIITPSSTSISDASKKILVANSPQLVTLSEAIAKTQFKNAVTRVNMTSKQNKSPCSHKLIEKNKMNVEFKYLYENKVQHLKSLSMSCSSEEEVVRVFLKGLPIVCEDNNYPQEMLIFSESFANEFGKLPLGRRRAVECWRAREIKKVLISLNLPNQKSWSVKKITFWARKHGFTPITFKGDLIKDVSAGSKFETQNGRLSSSLTVLHEHENSEKGTKSKISRSRSEDEFVVVDSEDGIDEDLSPRAGPDKEKIMADEQKIVEEPSFHSEDGCQFVQSALSKVRIKLLPEEIIPGITMELAQNTMWKATLSFMEDLLRSAYSAALDDRVDPEAESSNLLNDRSACFGINNWNLSKNPPTIEAKHIQMALVTGRPEFDLFTSSGLGKYRDKNYNQSLPSKES